MQEIPYLQTSPVRDAGWVSASPSPSGLGAGARLIALYVRRHPQAFALATVGAVLFGVATVAWSWAFGNVVEDVVRPFFAGETPGWRTAFLALIGIGMLRSTSAVLRRANAAIHRQRNTASWHEMVTDQLLAQPISFFRRQTTGDLLAAADNDADAAVTILSPLPYSLGVMVLLVTSIVWMLNVDLVLGAIGAATFPLLILANRRFEDKVQEPTERVQAGIAVLAGRTHEMVDGFGAVKALGLEGLMKQRLDEQITVVTTAKVEAMRIRVTFEAVQDIFIPVVNVLSILLGASRVRSGAMTVGELVSLLVLVNLMAWPLRLLGWALTDLPKSVAGARRVSALLNVTVPPLSLVLPTVASEHVIELRSVRVVHDDGRVALDGIDLDIRRGETLAIVGPTGSGKSTLLDVISGLETPASGERRVAATASDIVMVFQEPVVLNGTIASNLLLGSAGKVTKEHLKQATAIAEVDEFVAGFADGLATRVGERGVSLSGGQRQRLALARAIARRPDVLLLDDTTSSLDAETEERVLGRIETGAMAETLVIVAARPAAITFADRLVVLDEGKIVAVGTQSELLQTSPLYVQLVEALASNTKAPA